MDGPSGASPPAHSPPPTRSRRRLLVGASGVLAALAGCTGAGRESLEERPAGNAVVDGIRTAVGQANTVGIRLDAARANAEDPGDVEIDAAALRDRIATARGALDDADGREAAADYRDAIAAARAYVDVAAGMVDAMATLTDVADRLGTIESHVENEAYDSAASAVDDVQPELQSARLASDQAEQTIATLDAELLGEYGARVSEVSTGVSELAAIATAAEELGGGYGALLDGRDRLAAGRDAADAGDYGQALTAFEAAQSQFETATARFEAARQATDGEFSARIDRALCRSRALEDATAHLVASAEAARAGSLATAQRERDDGEADLDAARAC